MKDALRSLLCRLLGGHDEVFDNKRIRLRCVSCGHTSPGFDPTLPPPVVRYRKILRFRARLAR